MTHIHELTQVERQKGAKTPSLYRSLANALRKRKRCSVKCFYFEKCPLMSMSMSSADKKCMMKEFPEKIRSRFTKVFLEGEEGILSEIKTAIYQFGLQADTMTLREKRDYIELMLKLHKAIYGDKSQVITNNEPLQINIQQLQAQQLTDPKVMVAAVSSFKESKRSIALKEALKEECSEIASVEEDPESLYNSPTLGDIMRKNEVE